MTNNEAIILLQNLEDALDSYCELNEEGKTAFRMAIESLELFGNSEQLPSAQPDLSEYSDKLWEAAYERGKAEAQPKTGMWIKLDAHAHLADHKCSACGQECYVPTCMGDPMYDYCPNCGARMKEGEEHD